MEESRAETLLNAILNGETIDFNPQSRIEEYLKNCINKTGVAGLPAPQSRIDALLYQLADKLSNGGGSSNASVIGTWTFKDTVTLPEEMWDKTFHFKYAISNMSDNKVLLDSIHFGDDGTYLDLYDSVTGYSFNEYYCDTWNSEYYRFIEVIEEPPFEIAEWIRANAFYGIGFDIVKNVILKWFFNTRETAYLCAKLSTSYDLAAEKAKTVAGILDDLEFMITDGTGMFYKAFYVKTEAPLIDTKYMHIANDMFYACSGLTKVPSYNFRYVGEANLMFYGCMSLTEIWIKNIATNLQIGDSSWGQLLTVDSLIHLIYELRDTGRTRTLTMGSVNLEKLTNVYVKVIDITDEMRAEDDYVDEKLPFVVCESTDPDAILITEYVGAKNWALK